MFFIAFMGFVIRWLIHLQSANTACMIETKMELKIKDYLVKNWINLLLSFVSTGALVLIGPETLKLFNSEASWNSLVAFGCGSFSLELIKLVRNTFTSKFSRLGKLEVLALLVLASCATPEQTAVRRFNNLLTKYPFLAKTVTDSQTRQVIKPELALRSELGLIDSTKEADLIDSLTAIIAEKLSKAPCDTHYIHDTVKLRNDARNLATKVVSRCNELYSYDGLVFDTAGIVMKVRLSKGKLLFDFLQKADTTKHTVSITTVNIPNKVECVDRWWLWLLIGIGITLIVMWLIGKIVEP